MKFQHLYPFQSHWFDLEGLRYHYVDEGPSDAPVIVMLHGNPTWSFYYRTLIPELSQRYRVIAPDHIGCGLSDKPQNYPYTLAQHIHNLEAFLTHLKVSRIMLVAHDWGGAIGMGYATRQPANVARLVMFNTAAFFVPTLPWRIRICRIPWLGAFLVRGLNGFARGAQVFATAQPHRFTRAVRAGYLAPYDTWANRIALYRFVQDIPMAASHPTRRTLDAIEAALPRLRQHPLLIIWGAQDFCFTPQAFLPKWREHFPQAEVHILPQAGHYVVEDAYEQILPLLGEFLQRCDHLNNSSPQKHEE